MAWSISLERYALPPSFILSIYPPLTPVDAPLLRRYSTVSSPAKPFTFHNELQKSVECLRLSLSLKFPNPIVFVVQRPGEAAIFGLLASDKKKKRWGGGPNAVSKETGLPDCADWISTASDWLVTVYSPRANQRHRICPPMHRSSISALPLPRQPSILAPRQKRQSIRRLSLAFLSVISAGLSGHRRLEFYLTRQVSRAKRSRRSLRS